MKILSIILVVLGLTACSGISQEQDLRESPCAGSPCAGNLPEIPNAAAKV